MKKKVKGKNILVGKEVRVIVIIGNISIKYKGILQKLNGWVKLKTKEGIKLINKNDCALIEEIKP